MRAVDTNVVIRIIMRDNDSQVATADRFVGGGAWLSAIALLETSWVLGATYGLNPSQIADAIEMLLDHVDLTMEHAEAVRSAVHLFRARPSLGFADCLILEVARKAGHLPLGTFDRRLGSADGAQRI